MFSHIQCYHTPVVISVLLSLVLLVFIKLHLST